MLRKHFTMNSDIKGYYNIIYEASEYVQFLPETEYIKQICQKQNININDIQLNWVIFNDGVSKLCPFTFLGHTCKGNIYTWEFKGNIPEHFSTIALFVNGEQLHPNVFPIDYYDLYDTDFNSDYKVVGEVKYTPSPIVSSFLYLSVWPSFLRLKPSCVFNQTIIDFNCIPGHMFVGDDIVISKNAYKINGYGNPLDVATYPCINVNSISVHSNNPIYDSRDNCNAIIETATNKLIVGCAKTTIPEGIVTVDNYAIQYHTFDSITIPSTLQSWYMPYVGSKEFIYNGTINQWLTLRNSRKILLESDYNSGGRPYYQPLPATVHCIDGDYIEQ